MNFIEQFRAFWVAEKLLRDCGIPIKATHKSLYLALFHIANTTHWKPWFAVTQKQGLEYSGLSINTYFRCLYELEKWGLIKLKYKGVKHKPTQVHLTELISEMIYKHERTISDMIYAYLKNDIQTPKTYIIFDTILKQELKLLKTEKEFSISEEKKPVVKKPIVKLAQRRNDRVRL